MHCFAYNSLSEKEKALFDIMFEQLNNAKAEFWLENVSFEDAQKIYNCIVADNPQLFWLTESSNAQLLKNDNKQYLKFRPVFRIEANFAMLRNMQISLRDKVLSIANKAKEYESDYERILFVHDYLIHSCKYTENKANCYNAYGCLVENEAVCTGFTMAFQLIMNALNIPCGNVTGGIKSSGKDSRHIWNYVYLDNEYYYIDVTCDSPYTNMEFYPERIRYDFFCITTQDLALTHEISCKRFVPECTSTKYDYFIINNMYLKQFNMEQFSKIALKQLDEGDVFSIKLSSREECDKAYNAFMDNSYIMNSSEFNMIKSASGLIIYLVKKPQR